MGEEKTVAECYQFNKDTRSYVDAVKADYGKKLDQIEADIKELVRMLANRLPVWATLYISFLMLLVGGLLAKAVWG